LTNKYSPVFIRRGGAQSMFTYQWRERMADDLLDLCASQQKR